MGSAAEASWVDVAWAGSVDASAGEVGLGMLRWPPGRPPLWLEPPWLNPLIPFCNRLPMV